MYRLHLYTYSIHHIYVFIHIHTPAHTLSYTHTHAPFQEGRVAAHEPRLGPDKRRWACQAAVRLCVLLVFLLLKRRPSPPEVSSVSPNPNHSPKH